MWEDIGRYLSQLSPLMGLEFTPEQVQNVLKRYGLILVMPELQLVALWWNLACTYQTLFKFIQHPQKQENASGSDSNPATGLLAEPENQPTQVSIASVHKQKQWT